MTKKSTWEDEFAARLRMQASYLDDEGFTAGVMAALPETTVRAKVSIRQRLWLSLLAVAVGGFVLVQGSPWQRIPALWHGLATGDTTSILSMGVAVFVTVLVASGTWLAQDMKLL